MAYKLPRNMIKESEKRSELTSPGVYFLFGSGRMYGTFAWRIRRIGQEKQGYAGGTAYPERGNVSDGYRV